MKHMKRSEAEKAIVQLRGLVKDRESYLTGENDDECKADISALQFAIKAIGKIFPVKTVKKGCFAIGDTVCPVCFSTVRGQPNYCENCGRALDWSSEESED